MAVRPMKGGVRNDCFENVNRYVEENGGQRQLGWAIWEWPSVYVEAEFHAVWRSPTNNYFDVTPNEPPYPWILFVADNRRPYVGAQVDNIRRAITSDSLVSRFIEHAAKVHREKNKGDLKYFVGKMEPWPALRQMVGEQKEIERALAAKYGHLLAQAMKSRLEEPLPKLSAAG